MGERARIVEHHVLLRSRTTPTLTELKTAEESEREEESEGMKENQHLSLPPPLCARDTQPSVRIRPHSL